MVMVTDQGQAIPHYASSRPFAPVRTPEDRNAMETSTGEGIAVCMDDVIAGMYLLNARLANARVVFDSAQARAMLPVDADALIAGLLNDIAIAGERLSVMRARFPEVDQTLHVDELHAGPQRVEVDLGHSKVNTTLAADAVRALEEQKRGR